MLPSGAYALGEQPEPWLRAPASIDGDYVLLDRRRAEEWRPSLTTEIGLHDPIVELAYVAKPADVLRFVERFGLLWHGPDATEWRESLTAFQREANVLYRALDLYRDVNRASRDAAMLPELRERWQPDVESDATGWAFLEDAAIVVATVVNRGLEGVTERVLPRSSDRALAFVAAPRAPSLLGHIYAQFAFLMTVGAALRTCADPDCGRFFTVSDPRKRYCSKQHATRVRVRECRAVARREGDRS